MYDGKKRDHARRVACGRCDSAQDAPMVLAMLGLLPALVARRPEIERRIEDACMAADRGDLVGAGADDRRELLDVAGRVQT